MGKSTLLSSASCAIVEVIDNPENDYVLLNVSKERRCDDEVQLKLDRRTAEALGALLRAV